MNAIAALSHHGSAVAGRGDAELAAKGTGEVTLVRKAGFGRRLGGAPAGREEPPSQAHALLQKVGVRRRSHSP